MPVIKSEDVHYDNKPFNIFHVSWLEIALTNYKYKYSIPHAIDGNMSIGEFIRTYAREELEKCVVVKD
jgi:hypothetical protein